LSDAPAPGRTHKEFVMEPVAIILAITATRDHVLSARPHAPTVPVPPPRPRRAHAVIRAAAAAMSNVVERYRARRAASRRHHAIDRAIAKNPSPSLRQELTSMLSRD
jgi:hypothetical protein